MTMQMPKWKTFTMESYEIPHIYREPSKAVFTQKIDKVNEADVQWMIRPDGQYSDPTRMNEKIRVYPTGVDPVSKMKYGTNPYKLEVIRIPEVAAEQNIALSRPRIHQNKSVNTNPGIRESASVIDITNKIDLYNIKKLTSKEKVLTQVRPTSRYRIDFLDPEIFRVDFKNKAIDPNVDYYSISSGKMMKILTDSNRDANDVKSIADKIQLNNVLAPQSSHKTNENNQQYTKDKMKENTLYTNNVNAPYSMMKETNGNNETYVNDKISDKVRVLNVQASHSMPTTEVITPDLSLFSKRDLQKVISKQVFRKDDIGSAMEFNTQLNTKQVQNEKNSRPTMTEYSTPIMNTDVPVVHRVEKEDMMGRNMGGIPNMAARQSEQTMKENNKSNISFRMQMYNRDF
jgi:hypothetical protein